MRRRIIVTVILVIAALLLQTAVIPVIFPSFITPNLLLILVVSFGFMCGSRTGIWLGFVTGLLLDLLYGDFVGFNALLYMSLGYMNGRFCKVFFDEDLKVPMLLAGISDFIYGTVSLRAEEKSFLRSLFKIHDPSGSDLDDSFHDPDLQAPVLD